MNLLAFDTSTERISAAVQRGDVRWRYDGAGGPNASAALIPALLDLLVQASLTLADLDALVFGRGPGSFTGLRTACAVAQGLAFGAALPVLPVDTLLAVAEDARRKSAPHGAARVLALLDARMDQVYAAAYVWADGAWQAASSMTVGAPEALALPAAEPLDGAQPVDWVLAGNIFNSSADYAGRLPPPLRALPRIDARPTADALLVLAPARLAQGLAVAAHDALPLYIRDRVALTTAERSAARAERP
ncbi:MAG: tRNA (adenosine(37)-N6)-threonylcarbamoyltransferase complex dimerization subunit type 1 TsaB [Burkholderiaceae bacterium]|jgi:tRNA threonylcarbamoyladenosine biosynthesis protein TsaB|nr:tRNA (adenosine(37)-N6)-threonylcarbamoyltransferase complex dimerization subunit type 1 TsaB [Burkholderiaceae bacterium]